MAGAGPSPGLGTPRVARRFPPTLAVLFLFAAGIGGVVAPAAFTPAVFQFQHGTKSPCFRTGHALEAPAEQRPQ